jgi:hypothetical protein
MRIVVVKLMSGHSIIGGLESEKWNKVEISRPFAIERRMDATGGVADVLVPYVPYIKGTSIWINKKSVVTIYEVNETFTRFYNNTLDAYLQSEVFMADKAIKNFLEEQESIKKDMEEMDSVEVDENSFLFIPSSNTVH